MDCSDPDELLGRLADAQGAFAHAGSSTRQDERVNDGANYAGLMSMATYKEKRAEMTVKEDVNLNRDAMVAAARAVLSADRNAKDKAATDLEARELARKAKLKRELAGGGEQEDGGVGAGGTAAEEAGPSKKKKKKAAAAPGLSFDVDGEDG